MEDLKDLDYCSHRKFFNFYTVLPALLAILCFVGFLIGGIVDASVHQAAENFSQPRYGIMGLPNVFLCLLMQATEMDTRFLILPLSVDYAHSHRAEQTVLGIYRSADTGIL